MRDEQREAIDTLKEITENDLLNYWEGPEKPYNAIDTVLSLIKEQQEELKKQDRQIDLMADFMYKTGTGRRALSCMFRQNDECSENGCNYCIKQYFASLVEKE